jgi:hypothetical protein
MKGATGIYNYFKHLWLNWKVAGNALILVLFHFVHGLIPVCVTDHNFWGITAGEEDE